jgi:hypothetical protein
MRGQEYAPSVLSKLAWLDWCDDGDACGGGEEYEGVARALGDALVGYLRATLPRTALLGSFDFPAPMVEAAVENWRPEMLKFWSGLDLEFGDP